MHKTIDLDTVNSRAKVKLILMGGWAQAQGCSRGQDFIFHCVYNMIFTINWSIREGGVSKGERNVVRSGYGASISI